MLKIAQIHRVLRTLLTNLTPIHRLNSYYQQSTCIYALTSGHGHKCGVSVIRLSGRTSLSVLCALTKEPAASFKPRLMYLKNIWHPVTREKLDKGLVVWFKGTNLAYQLKYLTAWKMFGFHTFLKNRTVSPEKIFASFMFMVVQRSFPVF